jgi:glycolate oxidase FAD binding subunit
MRSWEEPKGLTPRDEADLVELVVATSANNGHLLIEGGGSRSRIGAPPAEGATRVDLGAFSGVIDYEPTELVLTAGPAMPMAEVETLLAANNQMLAFEPPRQAHLCGRPSAVPTLGGALASNAGGPRRLSAGAARDHFLGFRAVSGRGEAFKAGGKVVKNVTGFDLSKVMAGSWGTLAILTEVSVKVLPRPPFTATLVLTGLDPARACAAMARACASPAPITGAAHLNIHDGRPATLLRLEGFEPSVRVRIDALRALLAEFDKAELLECDDSLNLWREIGEVTPLGPLTTPLWRASIPAAQAPEFVARLPDDAWMMDWAGGLIWLAADAPPPLPGRDGHIQYWGGAPAASSPSAADQLSPAARRISLGLKAAFDPADVLNRGRLFPPLGAG